MFLPHTFTRIISNLNKYTLPVCHPYNENEHFPVFQSINEIDLGKNVKATVSMTFLKWIKQNKHIQIKQHAL